LRLKFLEQKKLTLQHLLEINFYTFSCRSHTLHEMRCYLQLHNVQTY